MIKCRRLLKTLFIAAMFYNNKQVAFNRLKWACFKNALQNVKMKITTVRLYDCPFLRVEPVFFLAPCNHCHPAVSCFNRFDHFMQQSQVRAVYPFSEQSDWEFVLSDTVYTMNFYHPFSLGNCHDDTGHGDEYMLIVILRKKLHETPVNTGFFS